MNTRKHARGCGCGADTEVASAARVRVAYAYVPSGCEHNSEDAVRLCGEGVENGQRKGRGFAGTGFCASDEVVALQDRRH